jgi:hypothetical protein
VSLWFEDATHAAPRGAGEPSAETRARTEVERGELGRDDRAASAAVERDERRIEPHVKDVRGIESN